MSKGKKARYALEFKIEANRADDTESARNVEPRHINLKTIVNQLRDRQRTEALDKRTEAVSTLNLPGGD